eukprot:TRINITY_DN331_c0_g3_i1.p1 TRINITY_DN331_c0_g3~~TRINITY_DN331_c0_g3_i1.p1  ORF type:complete len:214 (+),score=56.66 TRINITY_DN331_c0_g3_i1:139-780(+)
MCIRDSTNPHPDPGGLFGEDEQELMGHIRNLSQHSLGLKIDDLVCRARTLKAHLRILSALRERMPALIGKEAKQLELINDLESVFAEVAIQAKLSVGDMPPLEPYRASLRTLHSRNPNAFSAIPVPDRYELQKLEAMIAQVLPVLHTPCDSLEKEPARLLAQIEQDAQATRHTDQLVGYAKNLLAALAVGGGLVGIGWWWGSGRRAMVVSQQS